MIKVLVVADDLTGSNDTGALLSKAGFDTVASVYDDMDTELYRSRTALCLNADTRSMPEKKAGETVYRAVKKHFKEGMLLCKRIDSTLRGNVGAETDGALNALPDGAKAVVIPAFPRAGRICVNGNVLVNGVPLAESEAGRDVKTPVSSSAAADIIRLQTGRSMESFFLPEIRGDLQAFSERIRNSKADILIMDTETDDDTARIAAACKKAGIFTVCLDPGCFSVAMAKELFPEAAAEKKKQEAAHSEKDAAGKKNLLAVGSLSSAARAQIRYFTEKRGALLCEVNTRNLLEDPETEKMRVLTEILSRAEKFRDLVLMTDETVCSGGAQAVLDADRIADLFTDIGIALLEKTDGQIGCIYLSGGDTAKGFLSKMQLDGLEILDEVIPLAVYSKTISRSGRSVKLLTKGGMIGGETAVLDMICYAEGK